MTLQSRIWELYFANGVPSLFCCDEKEKMLEKLPRIGITRNYYTHWDEHLLDQVIAEEDLDRVNAVLIRILQYHFMCYIGFPFRATVGPIIFTMSDHDLVNHINLYEKYGFQSLGTRKGYYQDNNEDALIMWTENIWYDKYKVLYNQVTDELKNIEVDFES